jgi:hypothetical protein
MTRCFDGGGTVMCACCRHGCPARAATVRPSAIGPFWWTDPGGRAEGVLVDCDAEVLARLDATRRCSATRATRPRSRPRGPCRGGCLAARSSPDAGSGEAWDLDAWIARWGAGHASGGGRHHAAAGASEPHTGRPPRAHHPRAGACGPRTKDWHRPGASARALAPAMWRSLERRHPYDGFFTVEEVTARFRRFDGVARREVRPRRVLRHRCGHGSAL